VTGVQSALFRDAAITAFTGEYRFLSNFWVEPVSPQGPWWASEVCAEFPSVEHAFQAAKVEPATPGFVEHYMRIAEAGTVEERRPNPALAKQLGSARAFAEHGATLRKGWDEEVKVQVMLACLRAKFGLEGASHEGRYTVEVPELAGRLISTSPRVLVEGNAWGDTYWGVCRGQGKNMLGRLLMLVRAELLVAASAHVMPRELRWMP
jgi:predicted NAD-dependent protein-ADP-ribosyltransferase YbiA (DUF1768 family)